MVEQPIAAGLSDAKPLIMHVMGRSGIITSPISSIDAMRLHRMVACRAEGSAMIEEAPDTCHALPATQGGTSHAPHWRRHKAKATSPRHMCHLHRSHFEDT